MALKNTKQTTQAPSRYKPKQDRKFQSKASPPLSTRTHNLDNDIPNNVLHRSHRSHCTKPFPTPPPPPAWPPTGVPFHLSFILLSGLQVNLFHFHVSVFKYASCRFQQHGQGAAADTLTYISQQPTTGSLSNPHVREQRRLLHI